MRKNWEPYSLAAVRARAAVVTAEEWTHPYTRKQAVYPVPNLKREKFWPTTSRLNDTYGDRNLVCSCPPMESFMEEEDLIETTA